VSNFAVNNSNKAGTVFFGKESVTVDPYGKLELTEMPSYWTKNIQLVKGTVHSRGAKSSAAKDSDLKGGGSKEGGNNG
jgi:hypothetical protein